MGFVQRWGRIKFTAVDRAVPGPWVVAVLSISGTILYLVVRPITEYRLTINHASFVMLLDRPVAHIISEKRKTAAWLRKWAAIPHPYSQLSAVNMTY